MEIIGIKEWLEGGYRWGSVILDNGLTIYHDASTGTWFSEDKRRWREVFSEKVACYIIGFKEIN